MRRMRRTNEARRGEGRARTRARAAAARRRPAARHPCDASAHYLDPVHDARSSRSIASISTIGARAAAAARARPGGILRLRARRAAELLRSHSCASGRQRGSGRNRVAISSLHVSTASNFTIRLGAITLSIFLSAIQMGGAAHSTLAACEAACRGAEQQDPPRFPLAPHRL